MVHFRKAEVTDYARFIKLAFPYFGMSFVLCKTYLRTDHVQVGKDQRAQAFLAKLDKSRDVGDVIDCTSYYELEAEEFRKKGIDMTVELWLVKMMVGAFDDSYDAEDEG